MDVLLQGWERFFLIWFYGDWDGFVGEQIGWKHGIWISGGFEAKFEFLAKVKFEFWTSSRLSTIFGFGGFDGGLEGDGFGVTYGDFVVCKCWGMEGEFFGYFS